MMFTDDEVCQKRCIVQAEKYNDVNEQQGTSDPNSAKLCPSKIVSHYEYEKKIAMIFDLNPIGHLASLSRITDYAVDKE